MKRIMLVELDYDEDIMHGNDQASIEWFETDILMQGAGDERLILHSNEIGDEIGDIKVLDCYADFTIDQLRKELAAAQERATQWAEIAGEHGRDKDAAFVRVRELEESLIDLGTKSMQYCEKLEQENKRLREQRDKMAEWLVDEGHSCEFVTNPPKGSCEWCELLADYLAEQTLKDSTSK